MMMEMRKDLTSEVHSNHALRFSDRQREIFDTVAESMTVKDAAGKLGMDPQELYNYFYNLRRLYYKRFSWCNDINGQRSRSKLLKRMLTDRKHGNAKRQSLRKVAEEEGRRLRVLEGEDDFEGNLLAVGAER